MNRKTPVSLFKSSILLALGCLICIMSSFLYENQASHKRKKMQPLDIPLDAAFPEESKPSLDPCLYAVTFGDDRLKATRDRIVEEAKSFPLIREIFAYGDEELRQHGFMDENPGFIEANPQGFGLWLWKPWVIRHVLSAGKVPENCYLAYVDVGCTISKSGEARAMEYMQALHHQDKSVLAFQMPHLERKWTKGEIFDFFDARHLADTGQLVAGIAVYKNNEVSRRLVAEWYDIMRTHPKMVDNSPSATPNFPDFIDNRHDQSIRSLLIKHKYANDVLLFSDETWSESFNYSVPFLATRNKF